MKRPSEFILITSKRKLNLIENDRRKDLYNSIFHKFIINNNIEHYSRNTLSGAVFVERVNRTIRDLPKDLFLKKVAVFGLTYFLQ